METLADVSRALSRELAGLTFGPPVTHVYDPLDYAREPHEAFLERYGARKGRIVLVGMNPGPYGMAQTGVPFGEVDAVRDWMGVTGAVSRPANEHPKRPVLGFDHPRSEVSGQRLWGWARDRFGTAEAFFERFFVVNWCPLCFLEESGRNRTPDKLAKADRAALYAVCDRSLRQALDLLAPEVVVGVGAFAEQRAREVLAGADVKVGRVLHPSPANPHANATASGGWAESAERELRAQGISWA